MRGGPLRAGQQLFTKDECSTIFFICNASERHFHAQELIMVFIFNCKWHIYCVWRKLEIDKKLPKCDVKSSQI
jgi:hypothetical protein